MTKPMQNLTHLETNGRCYIWSMSWSCCGGFIGLASVSDEFNIISTNVFTDFDSCIKLAEKWHTFIIGNKSTFDEYTNSINYCQKAFKEFKGMKDFDTVINLCNSLEKWVRDGEEQYSKDASH